MQARQRKNATGRRRRCQSLALALVGLAAAAVPAQAAITPPSATVTAISSSSVISDSQGQRIRCAQIDVSGRVAADGRSISGAFRFGSSSGTTCEHSFLGSMEVPCTGSLTLRSTSSVAATSASLTLSLDRGYNCTFNALGIRRDVSGEQTAGLCVTVSQGPPTRLQVNCTFAVVQGGTLSVTATLQSSRGLTIS